MPTVIDQLLVQLSLDGSKFSKGAGDVAKAQKGIGASTLVLSKDMEAATRAMVAGVTKLRNEFLALFGLFTAGVGIKNFASQVASADAATSRTARNIGLTTAELYGFQKAGERAGGTAAGVKSAFEGIASAWTRFTTMGDGADDMLIALSRLGVSAFDAQGNIKALPQQLAEMNQAVQGMNRVEANEWLKRYGLDEGSRNLVLSSVAEFRKAVSDGFAGAPTKAWTDFAITVEQFFSRMGQRLEAFWRNVITPVAPMLEAVMRAIEAFFDRFIAPLGAQLGTLFEGVLKTTKEWLDSITSKDVAHVLDEMQKTFNDFRDTLTQIKDIFDAIHDWRPPEWMKKMFDLPDQPFHLLDNAKAAAKRPPDNRNIFLRVFSNSFAGRALQGLGVDLGAPTAAPPAENKPPPEPTWGDRFLRAWSGASGPAGGGGTPISGTTFDQKAPGVVSRLMADFGLKDFQAEGAVGNLGHESGLQAINERNPTVPGSRGGFGWAMWTGPRRDAFEAWARQRGLDPRSDEANYGFLAHELRTTESATLDALRRTRSRPSTWWNLRCS